MIYLDHNASTPLLPAAREAWLKVSDEFFGNPSSQHRAGLRADKILDDARHDLAGILGCEENSLVWTSGATESNNLAMFQASRAAKSEDRVWISPIEHPCLIASALRYFGEDRLDWIPVDASGIVQLDWITSKLKQGRRPFLIAVMAANNETGVLQPWREILQICQENEIFYLCDAAQWIGKYISKELGSCDWVVGSSHKFGGAKGCGFLKIPSKNGFQTSQRQVIRQSALIVGGSQELGRRAGTENPASIHAMVVALKAREAQIQSPGFFSDREMWREKLESQLISALGRKRIQVLGKEVPRLWNTSAILMPEPQNCRLRWVVKLDRLGVAVSTGSACSSGQEKISHVLQAMQVPNSKATQAIRISSGWETTEEDWRGATQSLLKLIQVIVPPHTGNIPQRESS